jgi:hypothetical protein
MNRRNRSMFTGADLNAWADRYGVGIILVERKYQQFPLRLFCESKDWPTVYLEAVPQSSSGAPPKPRS